MVRGDGTWTTNWKASWDERRTFTTSYGHDFERHRAASVAQASPARTAAPSSLGSPHKVLPPVASPRSVAEPLVQHSGDMGILPGEGAFRRAQQQATGAFNQFGRNGDLILRQGLPVGGSLWSPPAPQHALDSPSYRPRRLCSLTNFEETKNRTTHDYSAKMSELRSPRTGLSAATIDSRGIDTWYGRGPGAIANFVEATYARPYAPTSRGTGYGYASSR